jgi:hypothetical protein
MEFTVSGHGASPISAWFKVGHYGPGIEAKSHTTSA